MAALEHARFSATNNRVAIAGWSAADRRSSRLSNTSDVGTRERLKNEINDLNSLHDTQCERRTSFPCPALEAPDLALRKHPNWVSAQAQNAGNA